MLGIETIKQAAKVAIKFGQKLDDALEDNKVTWGEALGMLFGVAPDALAMVPQIGQIKQEYLDLDNQEREELVDYVVEELDLESDRAEEIAEAAFDALVSLEALVTTIRG